MGLSKRSQPIGAECGNAPVIGGDYKIVVVADCLQREGWLVLN